MRSRLAVTVCAAIAVALPTSAHAEDGVIPGVFAYNNGNFYVTATKADHNVVIITHSSDDLHLLITLNGNQISYPLVGVGSVSYQGGAGGSDTVTLSNTGAGTTNGLPQLQATVFQGQNQVSAAGTVSVSAYGDQNAFTAPAGTGLAVWAHGGPHNVYTGSGIQVTVDPLPYTPTAITGVFQVGEGVWIVGALAGNNQVTVSNDSSVNGVTVTENGQSVHIPSIPTTGVVEYLGGGNGGDSFTNQTFVGTVLTVWGDHNDVVGAASYYFWSYLYGDNDTVTMSGSTDCEVSLFGTGTTLHGTFTQEINADGGIVRIAGTVLSMAGGTPTTGGSSSGTTSGGTTSATGGSSTGTGTTSGGGSTTTGGGGTTTSAGDAGGTAAGSAGGASGTSGGGGSGCGLGASAAALLALALARPRRRR